jgi:SAM-dependent methyltransferase
MHKSTNACGVGLDAEPLPELSTQQKSLWVHSARHWSLVKSPLRPSLEDGAFILSALPPSYQDLDATFRVVVLGVTPEIVGLDWANHVQIFAFDQSEDMIRMAWRPNPRCESSVTRARWEELPINDSSVQAIAGDASLNALPRLEAFSDVLREMHRILAPTGRVVLRCFVRPDKAESLDVIYKDVFAHKVGSISSLKWRLAMALADPNSASIRLSSVFSAFEALFPSRDELAVATGWSSEEIATFDPYSDSPTCLNFPTLTQFQSVLAPWFDIIEKLQGSYELADRCPTLVLQHKTGL